MKVLVVGGGGREDALSWRLAQSPSCSAVVACPGNAGTASRGENWSDVLATDGRKIAARAREQNIELAVIGPETSIAAGVPDRLREAGIPTFGPNRSAGRLESSKVFAKRFMERHGVPTARARVAHSLEASRKILNGWHGGCVVKADGLAAGKGVVVTASPEEAVAVLSAWFSGSGVPGGGSEVLLEERLEGREVSVFALGDGRAFEPFASACDYKRAGDGDTGPNTGGMGAYSPPAAFPAQLHEAVRSRILAPVLRGLREEQETYIGVLYCGLMWTADGPKVIEFNVRFGDPETQALMPRVQGDFAALLRSCARGEREHPSVRFSDDACVAVVIATSDYPASATPVSGLPAGLDLGEGCAAFWGSSRLNGATVDASGGRVLTVSGLGQGVPAARDAAYAGVRRVAERFGNGRPLTYRSDIALEVAARP
jgi:phosphoribosylamine--glycine ligase